MRLYSLAVLRKSPLFSRKMDGSAANHQAVAPHQQSTLIRTDQVVKIPHLNEQQKAQHTQLVRNYWEILNTRSQSSPEYQAAHKGLAQLSQSLMKGMRIYQQNIRQQQQQQQSQAAAVAAAAAAAAQGGPRPGANPQNFTQLLPQIQAKVNSLSFYLPPSISKEQSGQWLTEAKLRYGIALQKQEMGRARVMEIRQQIQHRQAAGPLTQEEVQEFKTRQMQGEKLHREGAEFLAKFKEQQEGFKAHNAQQVGSQGPAPGQPAQVVAGAGNQSATTAGTGAAVTASGIQSNIPAAIRPTQSQPPAPHTINSAVNAARSQAGQTTQTVPPQPSTQTQMATPTTATTQASVPAITNQSQPPPPLTAGPVQGQTPVAPAATPQAPPTEGTAVQALTPQGPPRPLSHQAAIAQATQNYSNTSGTPTTASNSTTTSTTAAATIQPSSSGTPVTANTHSHPPGYIPNRSADNQSRGQTMAIPKTLNVSTPEPVSMGPARPTLSGGPSQAGMGPMGQPAIQKHPGYVLEGEGQRVLSKKKLNELVFQVTGGGEGEALTPEAEEVSLSHPPSLLLFLLLLFLLLLQCLSFNEHNKSCVYAGQLIYFVNGNVSSSSFKWPMTLWTTSFPSPVVCQNFVNHPPLRFVTSSLYWSENTICASLDLQLMIYVRSRKLNHRKVGYRRCLQSKQPK